MQDGSAQPISPAVPNSQSPELVTVGSPWAVFKVIADKRWLKNTFRLSWSYAPACIMPAVLGVVGSLCCLFGSYLSASSMTDSNFNAFNVIKAMLVLLVALGIAISAFVWSLSAWLMRLTTFCRAFEKLTSSQLLQPMSKDLMLTVFRQSAQEIEKRKVFLTKFYFVVSLYMVVPLLVFTVSFGLKMMVDYPQLLPGVTISLPSWLVTLAGLSAVISAGFLCVLSLISVVVSANSQRQAASAATEALSLSFKYCWPASALTAVMLLIFLLLSDPQAIFGYANRMQSFLSPGMLLMESGQSIWQGAVTVIMLPLMMSPFCELLRGRVK